jgi:hypothetical protein
MKENQRGETVLDLAISKGNETAVRNILAKVDSNQRDSSRRINRDISFGM